MKAYLRVEKNINKDVLEETKNQIYTIYLEKIFSIEDLTIFNPDYEEKENEINYHNELTIQSKRNKLYKPTIEIYNNINSYKVFLRLFNLGKLINDLIDKERLSTPKENNEFYDIYKNSIILVLNDKKHFKILLDEIISFINDFGFFTTPMFKNNIDINECNIVYFLMIAYFIYEAFFIRENLANGKNYYSKIFSYIYINPNDYNIFEHIENILIFLDSKFDNYCSFETSYDDDNECWYTNIIFNNALKLGIYELKVQLSKDNNDDTIGICKNIACNRSFKRTGFRQQYCLDDDCNLMRQNQRKQKSRQQKNK